MSVYEQADYWDELGLGRSEVAPPFAAIGYGVIKPMGGRLFDAKNHAKILIACTVLGSPALIAQVRQTKEQILFYTSEWKGERFPDGRPKVADDLLPRALNVSIEDIWDFCAARDT